MSRGPIAPPVAGLRPRQAATQRPPAEDGPAVLPRRETDISVASERVVGCQEIQGECCTAVRAESGGVLRRCFGDRSSDVGAAVEVVHEGNVGCRGVSGLWPAPEPPAAPRRRNLILTAIDRP